MNSLRKNNIEVRNDKIIVTIHKKQYIYTFDDISEYNYNEKEVIIKFKSKKKVRIDPVRDMWLIKIISKHNNNLTPKYIGHQRKNKNKFAIMVPYVLATLLFLFTSILMIVILLDEKQFEKSDLAIVIIWIMLWLFWIAVIVTKFKRK